MLFSRRNLVTAEEISPPTTSPPTTSSSTTSGTTSGTTPVTTSGTTVGVSDTLFICQVPCPLFPAGFQYRVPYPGISIS